VIIVSRRTKQQDKHRALEAHELDAHMSYFVDTLDTYSLATSEFEESAKQRR
jgi:hypothetical protein